MTESQLDNMLGLVEMAIAAAYQKPPLWCTCECKRSRFSAAQKTSYFLAIWDFLGHRGDPFLASAETLSGLLGEIKASAPKPVEPQAVGRKVLIERRKEAVVA